MPDDLERPDPNEGTIDNPPVAQKDDDDKEPDASQVVEQNGHRFVRVEALKQTREKLKTVREEAKAAKDKAAKYDLVAPYLGLLATHPDVVRRSGGGNRTVDDDNGRRSDRDRDPEPRRRAEPPPSVTDFDDVIESLGIDPEAGRKLATLVTHIADRRANKAVAPAAEAAHHSSAQLARQRAYAATDNNGQPYATREAIDQVFDSIPEHMLANDSTIKTALIQARGLGGPGKALEPLHTENVGVPGGRRGGKTETLSDLERKLMNTHGLSEEEYRDLSRQDTLLLE